MFCCKRCGKRKRKWWSGQKIAPGEKEDTKRRGSLDMDADEDLGGHVATTRLLCHHMTGSKRSLREEPKSATKAQKTEIQHLRGATGSSEQELWSIPNSYGQRPGEVEAGSCKRRSRTTRIGKHRCAEKCRNVGCVAGARKLLVKWWFMVRRTGSDADSIVPGVGVENRLGPCCIMAGHHHSRQQV